MPPRGVKKGSKRARQYEHIRESELDQGRSEGRAEEIAARTVNKARARAGESKSGLRSGTRRATGRTRDQLYGEARRKGVKGRSKMNKAQLAAAVTGRD